MSEIINVFAEFLGNIMDYVIIIFGIICILCFIMIAKQIKDLSESMDKKKRKTRGKKFTGSGYSESPDDYKWEDTLEQLNEYNKIQLFYSSVVQCIPIFPLMGILGTVSGLIQELRVADDNFDALKNALSVSMSTTFLGLIFAILLKFVDAVFINKGIGKMGMYFDTYEQNYQVAKDQHLFENEKNK